MQMLIPVILTGIGRHRKSPLWITRLMTGFSLQMLIPVILTGMGVRGVYTGQNRGAYRSPR